jgi:hypothetical protein
MAELPPQYVRLDVGGMHYTTLLCTLTRHPASMLGAMFAGPPPARTPASAGGDGVRVGPGLEAQGGGPGGGAVGLARDGAGAYLIDRDGQTFRWCARWLTGASRLS